MKILICGVIALMASAESSLEFSLSDLLKASCELNGVDYANVEMAITQCRECEDSLDFDMFERELNEAYNAGQYKMVFQKYCAKTPQLKTCYHTLFDVVVPCAGGEKHDITSITKHMTDQVLDYVCSNGGEPITSFMVNNGPQCIANNFVKITTCGKRYIHTGLETLLQTRSVFFRLADELMKCVEQNLKTCDNSATDFIKNLFEITRGGLTQMANRAPGGLTVSSVFFGLVLFAVIHTYI